MAVEVGRREVDRHPVWAFWTVPPLPPFFLPGSLGRPPGRPLEGTSLYLPISICHIRSSVPLVCPCCCRQLVIWFHQGWEERWAPQPGLGSSISRASGVDAGTICLRSQGARGRETARFLAPKKLLVHPGIPPLPFTLSCISNCISLALRRWLLCERLQGMATATAMESVQGTVGIGQGRARS